MIGAAVYGESLHIADSTIRPTNSSGTILNMLQLCFNTIMFSFMSKFFCTHSAQCYFSNMLGT